MAQHSLKGEVDHARKIFDQMGRRDSVSWNVMIKCYVENNRICNAREMFDKIPERTSVTLNTMIMGYIEAGKIHIALKLFTVMPDKDVISWTAIVTGLCRASLVNDAWRLFEQTPEANSVSWSSIISGFQQNGFFCESLNVFKKMLVHGTQPTSHSFTSALAACANLAMVSPSEQFYCQLFKRGFGGNTCIGNSAISMFVKAGSFHDARRVFVELINPDLVSWNSMIMGYAQHGCGVEAMIIFHQMQKARFLPDSISYMGVLHSCSHCGLVEEGKQYFKSMGVDYGISPEPVHFACMVDLFARAGKLKEAYEFIEKMPFVPKPIIWRTLLNGCRIWGDLELGVYAADRILELEPNNSSACSMVIDIFVLAGKWKEVAKMRRHMRQLEARKELGCSWINVKGKNHLFTTGDANHEDTDQIFSIIELLAEDTDIVQDWRFEG
ncbi:Pentatricopeptide repeat-containing protein [Forsythia ovata]|uniref:Pentatricopeptide repeat-containing protein n=1 Tax=Forsythia ovata TaxID=205694 RepID=A0ABD1T9N3_9LAMI